SGTAPSVSSSAVGSEKVVAPTTTRAVRMADRIRRAAIRAGSLWDMPLVWTPWCYQHICGFRYTDDMSCLIASRVYACVDRRGRAISGRSHTGWPAPGGIRPHVVRGG